MIDVAHEAGVSLKTVSRVVNDESVRSATRARVLEAIQVLGFHRNEMARNLKARRSADAVGLIIGDLGNPSYSAIGRGVEQVIREQDLMLITSSSEEKPERERDLILELTRRRVVGLIIVPTALDHAFVQREIDLGLAVVVLDRPAPGLSADTVLLDNRGGAREATEYLLRRGHRRIAVLGQRSTVWTMRERVEGFRLASRQAQVSINEELICLGPTTPEEASLATALLLEQRDPPTAFFACNNRMTIGILRELRRRAMDADVAGFGDIETADLLGHPVALVSFDPTEVGREAGRLLLDRLRGETARRQIVIPTRLVRHGDRQAGEEHSQESHAIVNGGTV